MKTIIFLFFSNLFMTFAWYGHLKNLNNKPLMFVIVFSWCIAFFEYTLQVPANRIGFQYYSLGQLKIIQEVITMIVFAMFAVFYMKQPLRLNFLWASICLVGAVYFMFRDGLPHH
ncbi:MAG: DMT family protein [Deltaproteobacteria bacterium]|nr:DMT family protein [Deltaproteobacteria bacterium]